MRKRKKMLRRAIQIEKCRELNIKKMDADTAYIKGEAHFRHHEYKWAAKCFARAADDSHPHAWYKWGCMHLFGWGTFKDSEIAELCFKVANVTGYGKSISEMMDSAKQLYHGTAE